MLEKESLQLPANFQLEAELLEQLSGRPGHQRCVEGSGELLLVVHDVPQPRIPERKAIYFWKRQDGHWVQEQGEGLSGLSGLLDRYASAIDKNEELLDETESAAGIFAILRHAAPINRSIRNMVGALEQVLAIDADDRAIRELRDRARELDRAAELLYADSRMALEFLRAESAEAAARSHERLNRIAFRLNLLAGFCLPLVALASLFGMNVDLPVFVKPMFWVILFGGLGVGTLLLYVVGRKTRERHFLSEEEQDLQ